MAETLKLEEAGQRVCHGEEEEFFERIDKQSGKLYSIAYSYLRSEADALEMLQEASYRAWSKRGSLKNDQLFDSWLIRILINCCTDELRKRKRVILSDKAVEDRGGAEMISSNRFQLKSVSFMYDEGNRAFLRFSVFKKNQSISEHAASYSHQIGNPALSEASRQKQSAALAAGVLQAGEEERKWTMCGETRIRIMRRKRKKRRFSIGSRRRKERCTLLP